MVLTSDEQFIISSQPTFFYEPSYGLAMWRQRAFKPKKKTMLALPHSEPYILPLRWQIQNWNDNKNVMKCFLDGCSCLSTKLL